ncbi:hypothetical protein PoB_006870800, partial [Plakobranchus ocellatus]
LPLENKTPAVGYLFTMPVDLARRADLPIRAEPDAQHNNRPRPRETTRTSWLRSASGYRRV